MARTQKTTRASTERYMQAMEKVFIPIITKLLIDQSKRIKTAFIKRMEKKQLTKEEAVKEAQSIVDSILDWDEEASAMFISLLPTYIQIGEQGVALNNLLFVSQDNQQTFSVIREDFLDYLNISGGEKIVQVTNTTKDIVKRTIRDGLIEGKTNSQIADDLVSKIEGLTPGRARTIAETEVHSTIMSAEEESIKAAGFKYWYWLTSGDEAVRKSHSDLNGQARKIGNKFSNGLVRPGDPNGPAKEIVRCRCVVIPLTDAEYRQRK